MPTGGAAIMRKGPNLLKLAKKEQCMSLTTLLRTKFKITPCFYRCVQRILIITIMVKKNSRTQLHVGKTLNTSSTHHPPTHPPTTALRLFPFPLC